MVRKALQVLVLLERATRIELATFSLGSLISIFAIILMYKDLWHEDNSHADSRLIFNRLLV